MEILKTIALDFGRDTLPVTVFAKQYDKESRYVKITPLNCGQSYTLENGITARIQLTKPDGHTVINDATIESNYIIAELTEQMLAAAGTAVAEIGLYKGDSLLSSQIFYIDVKKSAYNAEAVESSDEYNALVDALTSVDDAVSSANAAAELANTKAGLAAAAATNADTKAGLANAAAELANTKAALADTKAGLAAAAATNADTKAGLANAAAELANTKAGLADTAATGAANVNASISQTATGADITITNRNGESNTVHIDTLVAVNTWNDVKNAVRLGLGESLFPVGYEFSTPRETALSAAVGADNTGVTAVTVDEDAFLHAIGEAHNGVYEATYDGTAWHKENGDTVVLADYGISITGTPAQGDTILITETANTIIWVVRGHDHHAAADGHYIHTMTLETKYVYGTAAGTYKGLVFDAPEALYYCSEALPTGTYNFTWNYATGSMVNGTYQFTITEGVPAGGQIVLGTNSNSTAITSCKIKTYASVGATAAIESNIAVTEGSGGTSLGTIGATSGSVENLNCAQRIMWGSNNYAQSGARQWLNSAANLGSVWTPTNKFDRAPSWHTGSDSAYRGFMHGLGDDFLGAVQPAKIACRTNSVFEVDSLDGTEFTVNQVYELKDRFFLLSRPEIYGNYDSTSYKDGTQLEYYEGLTQTELIKRDGGGSARNAWLRSPNPSYANIGRIVITDGSLSSNSASNAHAVAPACIIA